MRVAAVAEAIAVVRLAALVARAAAALAVHLEMEQIGRAHV